MLKRILGTVRRSYPAVRITPAPHQMRTEGIIYRFHPSRSAGRKKNARLEMKFFADSLAGAIELYSHVRDLIVSNGDDRHVGEGLWALGIEEVAEGGASGYVSKTGLYFIQAGFSVTGY